jgi:hypothetical protein
MTKSQQKKLARAARLLERRAELKEKRRDKRRELREAAQQAARQRRAERDAAEAAAAAADGGGGNQQQQQQSKDEAMRLARERREAEARARAERRAAATSDAAPRVAVDLRWADGRMRDGERRSLAQQLSFAYSAALRAEPAPVHLLLLGAGGLLRRQMEAQLPGMARWAATVVHDEGLLPEGGEGRGGGERGGGGGGGPAAAAAEAGVAAFEDDGGDAGSVPIAEYFARRGVAARDLVYLSADSPHELDGDEEDEGQGGDEPRRRPPPPRPPQAGEEGGGGVVPLPPPAAAKRPRPAGLDLSKVYVVGGIVDRNRYKGACLRRAEAAGMSHARLPIARHLAAEAADDGGGGGGGTGAGRRLAGSRVLTVNQVVEMLARRASGDTWAQAVAASLPQRKTAEVVVGAAAGGGAAAEAGREREGGAAAAETTT